MRGPYRITRVLDHGRYELKLVSGAYGKVTYAAAQYLVPWRGEWTPETCAAFFEGEENDDVSADAVTAQSDPTQEQPGPSSKPDEDVRLSGEAVLAATPEADSPSHPPTSQSV
ncbi:uncharacterized protein LOC121739576 [Aricia agestis]|nr:uncharacterized protein LOC121739576 [Aricia agestis]